MSLQLMPETLFLTTNLIDRFLEKKRVSRRNLQLVRGRPLSSLPCLLLASAAAPLSAALMHALLWPLRSCCGSLACNPPSAESTGHAAHYLSHNVHCFSPHLRLELGAAVLCMNCEQVTLAGTGGRDSDAGGVQV